LNILGIAPYQFLPPQMGGQKYIEVFYRYLGADVNTIVASTQNNEQAYVRDYTLEKVFDNNRTRYINPIYIFKLRKLIRQHNITHVILEHPYMGWMAVALQKTLGVKLIAHSHNIEGERFRSMHKKWWKLLWHYEKWLHKQADYNFFITELDLQYAVKHFDLNLAKCSTAFYGIERSKLPGNEQKITAREYINQKLKLSTAPLLLFNGNFSYQPNLNALLVLVNTIVPLLNNDNYNFNLVICGKGIPEDIRTKRFDNVLIKDFVPDISIYNLAADVFLNPVIEGGGVKTKIVEALAADTTVISTRSGANGVDKEWCGDKLIIVEDTDWTAFYRAIKANANNTKSVPEVFFQQFFMGNIVKKVKAILETRTL